MKKIFLLILIIFILAGCTATFGKEKIAEKEQGEDQSKLEEQGQMEEAGQESDENNAPQEPDQKPDESNASQEEGEPALSLESQYFNEIKEVGGKYIIQNPLNILALVNKQYSLPDDYVPEDLVRPNVPFSFGNQDIEKSYMRKEAAQYLEKMFNDAKAAGIELFAVSGYRSYDRQETIFTNKASSSGIEAAAKVVAEPGFSEHQTGLAMDISARSVQFQLTEKFGETAEGKWLAENAHKYGFILRYPKGKEEITSYQYEPWHFRYVGIEAAAVIYEKELTLEEFFNLVEKI